MKMKVKTEQSFLSPPKPLTPMINHQTNTHHFQANIHDDDDDDDVEYYGNGHHHRHHHYPPKFTKGSSSHISSAIDGTSDSSKMMMMMTNIPYSSSSPSFTKSEKIFGYQPATWSMGSLMAALPLTPSPICSSPSQTPTHPSSSPLPCDFSRASAEFFTPSRRSASLKKKDQSPRCMSMSTLYESAIDHHYGGGDENNGNPVQNNVDSRPKSMVISAVSYDYEPFTLKSIADDDDNDHGFMSSVLPSVPEERSYLRRKRSEEFAGAAPVIIEEAEERENEEYEEELQPRVNRPRPYHEFLNEVQKHKSRAEFDTCRKAAYANLLQKLSKKEAAIDGWESKQRKKAELQLDKFEKKLEQKRAKAIQKMHKKVAATKMEAEKKKGKERRKALKEIAKLSKKLQANSATPKSSVVPVYHA